MTQRWVFRLAVAAAVFTYLLLTVGGIVTSREAGMIFADWPLSEGSVNPDGWTRDADKASEHGHRLLGGLVGLLTIVLALSIQRTDKRRFVRVLGWFALLFVIVQGLLGGLRVTEISPELALVHGCSGQAFFCLMVALAYLLSRDARRHPEDGADPRPFVMIAAAVVFVIFMQIVVGAQLRHQNGPIVAHVLGAMFVLGSVVWLLTIATMRYGDRPALRRPVFLLAALLLAQIALGIVSAHVILNAKGLELTAAEVLLPTAHQSVGALMLATSVVALLRGRHRLRPSPREVFA
ncbi:MAG: COX15/CtaA family protein [Planctomycetota bacterium]|nr:COX15/CtaA family protein [Planctomycetota bacterium]